MWTDIVNEGRDLTWVNEDLQDGSAILVSDGSYNPELAPALCGAGWLIYCPRTKRRLMGYFYETGPASNAYRAESLGLLALHTLLCALETHFAIEIPSVKLCCDGQGALYKSRDLGKRVPVGTKHADIFRALRSAKALLATSVTYDWVESHQDLLFEWEELSIEQQLNCMCDDMAKRAVQMGMMNPARDPRQQVLPHEKALLVINGCKQTSDVSAAARFELGLVEAEKFYVGELKWDKAAFHAVDWQALDAALEPKGQMYKLWLAKQTSGFCGTQSMVSRWSDERDDKCPNCGQRETAAHLNRCPDEWRTRLFRDSVASLHKWMEETGTHTELAYWLPKYILLRGTRRLSSFPYHTSDMLRVAEAIDSVPWKDFMEGKVAKEVFRLQALTLAAGGSRLSGASWAKQFISRLLHISHSQWIFRNVSLHDKATGYLRLRKRRDLLLKIDELLETDPQALPPESRYLLLQSVRRAKILLGLCDERRLIFPGGPLGMTSWPRYLHSVRFRKYTYYTYFTRNRL